MTSETAHSVTRLAIGMGKRLYCKCKRGPSGTVYDGVRDPHCIWDKDEILYDGPAGSGKTFQDMLRFRWLAENYPRFRGLIVRQTLKALRDGGQPILEDAVLGSGHPALQQGGARNNRTEYNFPSNPDKPDVLDGGRIVLAGLDKPELFRSSEWDAILFLEATDPRVFEHHWTLLGTRCRGTGVPHPHCMFPDGVMPEGGTVLDALVSGDPRVHGGFSRGDPRHKENAGNDAHGCPVFWHQRVAECNPSMQGKAHWLWKRYWSGKMWRLKATHADNPTFTGKYKSELEALTGNFRKAYLEGEWEMDTSGLVWPTYKPEVHLISGEWHFDTVGGKRWVVVPEWTDENGRAKAHAVTAVTAGFDWGLNSPGSLQVVAHTPDRVSFRIAEVYRKQTGKSTDEGSIDWWAQQVVELVDKYAIEVIWCDPSARAIWELFNTRLGNRCGREVGGICQGADNTRASSGGLMGGLDVVRTLFAQNRLFLFHHCHHGKRDPELVRTHQPSGLHEELQGYALDRDKDDPEKILDVPADKQADHGCDALRYDLVQEFARERAIRPINPVVNSGDPWLIESTETMMARRRQEQAGRPTRPTLSAFRHRR